MLNYLYLIYIIGWFALAFGLIAKQRILYALGSFILLFAGFTTVTDGLGGVDNQTTEYFGVFNVIIGSAILLKEVAEELEKIDI